MPPVAMNQVLAGPMAASLQLVDKQWGTSIVINCRYTGSHAAGLNYQLVVFDDAGAQQPVGWWKSIAGSATTVTTASSVRLSRISRLEVQLSDGLRVLTAVPPHR